MLFNVSDRDPDYSIGYRDPSAQVWITAETLADGTWLVSVRGEVDLHTAPHLERVLDDAMRAGEGDLHVELARHSFIDSTGLRVLIQAAQRLEAMGRSLRASTENPHTRGVIETMGLAEKMGLGPSAEE